ncbi:MAG: hypothetical protein HRT71_14750 [Flavobacteriales bacterium]|nr:hypothetical protein [Flavobacteriales bacterium]
MSNTINAQELNNWRQNSYIVENDTIKLDSLSLIPGSVLIYSASGVRLNDSLYTINYGKSLFILKSVESSKKIIGDKIRAEFRVFPLDFGKKYAHKNINVLEPSDKGMYNPFMYTHQQKKNEIFLNDGLNKSGSISRGVTIGNNQDLSVNSNLDLQIAGKLNDRVSILAAITDRNIPIQPDGTTVQIQEFDRAYIQIYDDKSKLTVGDFRIEEKTDHFMTFLKKARGGLFETTTAGDKVFKKDSKGIYTTRLSGAISKGKFSRYTVQGREGIQGPYKLGGSNNERFIVVLSGTERVFVDGVLLKRGQDHDYIINYNTAELTFTAKMMITKDKRIVVEFQYSDRNYVRSMFNVSSGYKTDKFSLGIKYYSEQDNKNQPLQQDLTDSNKLILAHAGDNLLDAVVPTDVLIPFTNSEVLYRKVDTLGYIGVLVYLDYQDSVAYRASFSNVGAGNGNYVQTNTSANGRVYEWIEPLFGVSQGAYEPITVLAAPSRKELISLNSEIKITKETKAIINLARSNHDLNLFSNKDSADNVGYAFYVKLLNERTMFNDTAKHPWKLKSHVSIEGLEKDFSSIERFRSVEFKRDWNLQNSTFESNQLLGEVALGLSKKGKGNFLYRLNSFTEQNKYRIIKNDFTSNYKSNRYTTTFRGSHLTSSDEKGNEVNTFIRVKGNVSKASDKFTIGIKEEYERNEFKDLELSNSSYEFIAVEGYISNSDSAVNRYTLNYKHRIDRGRIKGEEVFLNATLGQHIGFTSDIRKNRNSIIKSTTEFRRLTLNRESFGVNQTEEADNTLVNRIEYLVKIFKGVITARSFYEIGSGLEVKKEFRYIEVGNASGVYIWKDYNNDGFQDLNEFETETDVTANEGTFIKLFTPTTDYIKTSNNQFNQSIYIKPSIIWRKNKSGILKQLAKFSTQSTYRIDRKSTNEDPKKAYNPFDGTRSDSIDPSLISENYSLRNILFLNKGRSQIGGDLHTNQTRNKIILVNGFDERSEQISGVNIRWNLNKKFTLTGRYDIGLKSYSSEFFSNKDYRIKYGKVNSKFSFQPNTSYRISAIYNYQDKRNRIGNETAIIHEFGSEFKFNSVTKGSLLAEIKFITIAYNNNPESLNSPSLTYEMLSGLQKGENVTWKLSFQKKLANNMQISINYNGRYSESANVVHIGGAQVRAFF